VRAGFRISIGRRRVRREVVDREPTKVAIGGRLAIGVRKIFGQLQVLGEGQRPNRSGALVLLGAHAVDAGTGIPGRGGRCDQVAVRGAQVDACPDGGVVTLHAGCADGRPTAIGAILTPSGKDLPGGAVGRPGRTVVHPVAFARTVRRSGSVRAWLSRFVHRALLRRLT
jgi:hypothetical protein